MSFGCDTVSNHNMDFMKAIKTPGKNAVSRQGFHTFRNFTRYEQIMLISIKSLASLAINDWPVCQQCSQGLSVRKKTGFVFFNLFDITSKNVIDQFHALSLFL